MFSGYRLVQISDIHMGGWMNKQRLSQILDTVKGLEPQLVVLSGDFVQGRSPVLTSMPELDELEAALKGLAGQFPTLAVLGNHDYWFGAPLVLAMLQRSGIRTMQNSVQKVQIGQAFIFFAGVDDVSEGEDRIQEVLTKLPEKACTILIVHEPDFADESAATGRFDLQISGHSHGGQVNLPFFGPPVLPHLAHKYPAGLYRVGNMYQYTNRGVGMTPPFIRINCRPEITVFTLQSS
jgi:predicted MPP superfamily phosphohydrolase